MSTINKNELSFMERSLFIIALLGIIIFGIGTVGFLSFLSGGSGGSLTLSAQKVEGFSVTTAITAFERQVAADLGTLLVQAGGAQPNYRRTAALTVGDKTIQYAPVPRGAVTVKDFLNRGGGVIGVMKVMSHPSPVPLNSRDPRITIPNGVYAVRLTISPENLFQSQAQLIGRGGVVVKATQAGFGLEVARSLIPARASSVSAESLAGAQEIFTNFAQGPFRVTPPAAPSSGPPNFGPFELPSSGTLDLPPLGGDDGDVPPPDDDDDDGFHAFCDNLRFFEGDDFRMTAPPRPSNPFSVSVFGVDVTFGYDSNIGVYCTGNLSF